MDSRSAAELLENPAGALERLAQAGGASFPHLAQARAYTADQLAGLFDELPEAGLCFDVAHAKSVDPSMEEGARILDAFGDRLRHVHLSSLDSTCHHVPLTAEDESLFAPLLSRCRDVPWILEAPTSS